VTSARVGSVGSSTSCTVPRPATRTSGAIGMSVWRSSPGVESSNDIGAPAGMRPVTRTSPASVVSAAVSARSVATPSRRPQPRAQPANDSSCGKPSDRSVPAHIGSACAMIDTRGGPSVHPGGRSTRTSAVARASSRCTRAYAVSPSVQSVDRCRTMLSISVVPGYGPTIWPLARNASTVTTSWTSIRIVAERPSTSSPG